MSFGNFVRIENIGSLAAGEVRLLAAVEAAGIEASRMAGEAMKSAWQDQIDSVLTHGYATGKYHDSITVGDPVVAGTLIEVEVSSEAMNAQDYSYPIALEYGWTDKGGNHHGPYPTMTPAMEQSGEQIVALMAATEGSVLNAWFPGSATGGLLDLGFQTAILQESLAQMEALYGGGAWTVANFKKK